MEDVFSAFSVWIVILFESSGDLSCQQFRVKVSFRENGI